MSDEGFELSYLWRAEEAPDARPAKIAPERALLAAMITRAIMDYTGPDVYEAGQASAWIFLSPTAYVRPADREWTFEAVCRSLDMIPDRMRMAIKKAPMRLQIRNRNYKATMRAA